MLPPIHPVCLLFPLMSDEELNGLAEDIRRRGELLEPIVLYKGAILDGRNRLEACRRAEAPPRYITFNGPGSPLEWAIAKNLRRRHFSPSQRAVIALQILPLLEEEARERKLRGVSPDRTISQTCDTVPAGGEVRQGPASGEAARLVGASPRYVQLAKRMQKEWPEILPEVAAGKLSLHDAEFAAGLGARTRDAALRRAREAPAGKAMNFRRMLREDREFLLGGVGGHRFAIRLGDDELELLDDGEEIPVTLGERACRLRREQLLAADSEGSHSLCGIENEEYLAQRS